ncbi:MAG: phosphonoacetaldehyde hydrolase [Clostridiales bacterium]|jgi:phosphonoacetaldehyde hydrolase|nr:phosphonoacetaldehyde hydrolase [Clostridiales bacterium]
MGKIRAVILDWAGTAVDFGCFAPVDAFAAAFEAFGIEPTAEEIRAPMGLAKRAHIEKMLQGERLRALWRERHGREWAEGDVAEIYARFEPALFGALEDHAGLLPGVAGLARGLRAMGVAIGSTTGYTRAMMDELAPLAAKRGYAPDCIVCPEDAGGIGRPSPYMLWRCLERLGVQSIAEAAKIGDTDADIREGKNAGCIAVGVLAGSSMVGLGEEQHRRMGEQDRAALFAQARLSYEAAGADYVLDDISGLIGLIEQIEQAEESSKLS